MYSLCKTVVELKIGKCHHYINFTLMWYTKSLHRQERRTEENYLDLTFMKLLHSKVKIDLPNLVLKHMNCVLHQDKNGHSLAYGFWLGHIFKEFDVPILVWEYQTTRMFLTRSVTLLSLNL